MFNSTSLQATIKVKSSEAWTLTTDAAWLSLSETAGTATSGTVITVTATVQSANTTAYISATTSSFSAVCECIYTARVIVPNNEIWYTSTNGQIVTPFRAATWFGAHTWLSNTYTNGKGVLVADIWITSTAGSGFLNCSTLETIMLPEGLQRLDAESFKGCNNLISVTAGANVVEVHEGTFGPNSRDIYYYSTATPTLDAGSNNSPWRFTNSSVSGVFHYKAAAGSNLNNLLAYLPSNWTAVADL